MKKLVARFIQETEGQDLIEYALLAALIALAVTTILTGVGSALSFRFNAVSTSVAS